MNRRGFLKSAIALAGVIVAGPAMKLAPPVVRGPTGFAAWLPDSIPGEQFFGVDRTDGGTRALTPDLPAEVYEEMLKKFYNRSPW